MHRLAGFIHRLEKQKKAIRKNKVFCIRYFSKVKHKPMKKNKGQWFSMKLKVTCKNSGTSEKTKILTQNGTNSPLGLVPFLLINWTAVVYYTPIKDKPSGLGHMLYQVINNI